MPTCKSPMAPMLALALLALGPQPLMAKECSTRSGPYKNTLLELYTSEGCSSCPPADRWLSSIRPGEEQPRVIPIAFHVSYWDYIGWKDAFADARFTERQRAFASATGQRSVYTPQVVLDGKDYPRWHARDASAFRSVAPVPAKASLELAQSRESDVITARVKVSAPRDIDAARLALVVVLTENRLGSRVTAGENRGATLRHEFVARDIATFRIERGNEYQARFTAKPDWKPLDTHLVAFIQNLSTGEVLQAVSSCNNPT
jgi:hypothetical protein